MDKLRTENCLLKSLFIKNDINTHASLNSHLILLYHRCNLITSRSPMQSLQSNSFDLIINVCPSGIEKKVFQVLSGTEMENTA